MNTITYGHKVTGVGIEPIPPYMVDRLFGNLLSARGNWVLDPEARRPNPD